VWHFDSERRRRYPFIMVALTSRRQQALLLAGDLVCFLAFALLGLRSHEDGVTPDGVLRAATPFQAGWLLAGLVPALHERRSAHRSTGVLRRWLPAWALGLAIRTLAFGRAFAPTFAIVSLVTNLLLLLAWRSWLARLLLRGR
jgi:hypothetical protein